MTRTELGLPEDWSRVKRWLSHRSTNFNRPPTNIPQRKKKCPEIPSLLAYNVPPHPNFWNFFPKNALPKTPNTCVDIPMLKSKISEVKHKLTWAQLQRAQKCVVSLEKGGDSGQMKPLPPCFQRNAPSTVKFGEEVVDTVASWVKSRFVSGPFDQPPLPTFRVNPLMAVDQGEKVRVVLNVSSPKGLSFNDNVEQESVERVSMSSARNVSFVIHEAGKNAIMSKIDMKDAYKMVPAPIADLRLQGFSLLGKYFVETQQIFGSQKAVENFDRLSNTVHRISIIESDVNPGQVPRQLDDVICVSPAGSGNCKKFSDTFLGNCKKLQIPLAPNCPNLEKAFYCSTYGKILGIFFDTTTLSWRLPEDKIQKTLQAISDAVSTEKMSLLQMQKLMGRLNDVSLMCPFLNGFKRPLNDLLGLLQRTGIPTPLSAQAKEDLFVWVGFLSDPEKWNHICPRPVGPPLHRKEFTSDAAGAGKDSSGRIGCGSIGLNSKGEIIFVSQLFWDRKNFLDKTDEKGACLRNKTTTLELVGVLLPFLQIPEQLRNQHVIVKVDNISCIFGWENRSVQGDSHASILIRTLHVVSSFLGCVVHFQHLPRVSTWDARLADRLSRETTTTKADKELLSSFPPMKIPKALENWLKNPVESYALANQILEEVEMRFSYGS